MESQRQEPARGEKSFTTEVERGAGGHSCQRSHHTDQQSSSRRDPSHSKVQQNRAPFIVATTNIVLTNRLKWALCILLRINAYSAFPIERWRFFASSYRLLVLCGATGQREREAAVDSVSRPSKETPSRLLLRTIKFLKLLYRYSGSFRCSLLYEL